MRPPHLSVNLHPNRVGATLAGGPRPWFHVYSPATLYLTGPRTHHVYTGRRDLTKCRAAAYSSHLSRAQRGTAAHLSVGPYLDLSLNTIRFANLSTLMLLSLAAQSWIVTPMKIVPSLTLYRASAPKD